MTRRATALPRAARAAAVVAVFACEPPPARDAAPPPLADSAGWRAAHLSHGAVALRYPTALVAGVVDRTTPRCDEPDVAALLGDTTLDGRLVALTTSQPIDSVAAPLGFTRHDGSWWLDPPPTDRGWSGGEETTSLDDAPWAAVLGEVTMKIAAEDVPVADGDAHATPDTWHQHRLVAVRPLTGSCALALVWWGDERPTADDSARAAGRDAALRGLLRSARMAR